MDWLHCVALTGSPAAKCIWRRLYSTLPVCIQSSLWCFLFISYETNILEEHCWSRYCIHQSAQQIFNRLLQAAVQVSSWAWGKVSTLQVLPRWNFWHEIYNNSLFQVKAIQSVQKWKIHIPHNASTICFRGDLVAKLPYNWRGYARRHWRHTIGAHQSWVT